jgi:GT2 family glycosyltransferase
MSISQDKIVFIVATKDRPLELRRMLRSIEIQSHQPYEIIIVDGGYKLSGEIIDEFSGLRIKYLKFKPASATKQRNFGIKMVNPEITFIGFLDDDVVLEKDSIKKMMSFWEEASENIGGAAFNMVNHPQLYAKNIKSLPIVEKLGLYSNLRGVVLPSGFHTMIGYVPETIFVQWLSTCAVVWRRKIFEEFHFDEWFSGYSYLEDLDFSYRVGKKYRLAVVAAARYYHYPASPGRINEYIFGRREVANRIYFVRKNRELSFLKCYFALTIRMFLNIALAIQKRKVDYLKRFGGNITELMKLILAIN